MNSLSKGKRHMPATHTKVDNRMYGSSVHPFHSVGATGDSEAHCPACAMVDELIQELIRKQLSQAKRS